MLKWISLGLGLIGLVAGTGALFGDADEGAGARLSRHGNGAPKESTFFVDGLRDGPTTRWYADGTLRAEGVFERGEMVGDWIWYGPDGEVDRARSGEYRDGERLAAAPGTPETDGGV